MKVNTLYFGMIAEKRGFQSETLELPEGATLLSVQEKAQELIPDLGETNYAIALNQNMNSENVDLKDGDEISFFPPFAGG